MYMRTSSLLALLVAATALGQTQATLRVKLLDGNGVPLAGRTLVLESLERAIRLELRTNPYGVAVAAGLNHRAYRILGQVLLLKDDERAEVLFRGRRYGRADQCTHAVSAYQIAFGTSVTHFRQSSVWF